MGKILGFFTPKVGLWGVVGLLALLVATITTEEIRLSDAHKSIKSAQAATMLCIDDRAVLRTNVATLTAAIDGQNAKIKAAEAEGRRRAALAAAASKKALEDTKKRQGDASRLGSGPDIMNAWQRSLFQ